MLFSHVCNINYITGAEKWLLFFTRELNPRNDCILVVPNDGILAADARNIGINVIIEPSDGCLWSLYEPTSTLLEEIHQLRSDPSFSSYINLLHTYRPDWVVVNTCVNVLPAMAAKMLQIPVMWIINEILVINNYTMHSVDVIERYSDWIVGVSHATLSPFQHKNSIPRKIVLYPAFRREEFNPLSWDSNRHELRISHGISEDLPVVGYISAYFTPKKGLKDFIRMAIQLCHDGVEAYFFIIGNPVDPDYFEHCLQMVKITKWSHRFVIVDFHSRIETLYPAMDVVVIPSLIDEGFGLTALEGLIFGKPVVAYNSGGLAEILCLTGNEKFLSPKGDIDGLVNRVKELLSVESLRCRVTERNVSAVQETFGIDIFLHRLEGILSIVYGDIEILQTIPSLLLNYRDGTLFKGELTPTVYRLEIGTKRPFPSEFDFRYYKNHWRDVHVVSEAELYRLPTAPPIIAEPPQAYDGTATFHADKKQKSKRHKRRRKRHKKNLKKTKKLRLKRKHKKRK